MLVLIVVVSFRVSEEQRDESDGEVNKQGFAVENSSSSCDNGSLCPTWFTCNSQSQCRCGSVGNDIVVCDNELQISAVLDCHCVTYDNETGSTYAGTCFFNCENHHTARKRDLVYYTLPKSPEMLLMNHSICSYFHRTGLLCGDCEDGHSPLVLSYNLSCVRCPDGHKNWWKFILVAFVPLTLFYFIVFIFNINVTSSRLHGVVWFSQALAVPVMLRMVLSALSQGHPKLLKALMIILIFYGFWNLELFRSVLPDICLNVTTLQALALEYVIALYPFLLVILSKFAIELYDRKFICIVSLLKPFRNLLTLFRRSWDIRTSTIDSFSTFFFLSYFKIISVSSDLLIPTEIHQLGSNKSSFGLYYSPSVEYFGAEHLPYAILAIVILTFFVCIPMAIVFLYPFRFFQRFLSLFPFINWHFLRAFVDSYQGCYKDGTEPGTLDCRWFSAFALFSRLLLFFTYGVTLSLMYFVYAVIVLLIFLIAMINIQPYKVNAVRYPATDQVFLVFLSLFYISLIGRSLASIHGYVLFIVLTFLSCSSAFVSMVYIIFFIIVWIISKRKCVGFTK